MRDACLQPNACKAKTPNKNCRQCSLTKHNTSAEHRERSRKRGLERDWFRHKADNTHTPEANAAREEARMATMFPWLPVEYRALHTELRIKTKLTAAERKQVVLDQIAKDKADAERAANDLGKRIERSHEKMKRGGSLGRKGHSLSGTVLG